LPVYVAAEIEIVPDSVGDERTPLGIVRPVGSVVTSAGTPEPFVATTALLTIVIPETTDDVPEDE
jgi:hypothetical protein